MIHPESAPAVDATTIAELEAKAQDDGCTLAQAQLNDIARGGYGVARIACFCKHCTIAR